MLCECIAVQWVANIFLCVSCRSFRFLMKLCYSGCASVRLLPFSFPFLTFTPSDHPISFRQTYSINRFDVLCTVLCCAELCSASPPLLLLLFTCHYETRFIVWFLLNADAFSGVMFLNILLFLCVFRFILSIVFFFIPNWNSCVVCMYRMKCKNSTNSIVHFDHGRAKERARKRKGRMRRGERMPHKNRENNYTFKKLSLLFAYSSNKGRHKGQM